MIYERNRELISFRNIKDLSDTFISEKNSDFSKLREIFTNLNFNSMVSEKSWKKYVGTFERISDEAVAT